VSSCGTKEGDGEYPLKSKETCGGSKPISIIV